jgi:D-alanyl-D-alanine dipeptidase
MPNKLSNRLYILNLLVFIFSTGIYTSLSAQDSSYTKPPLTSKWDDYEKQVRKDSAKRMVELKRLVPGIVYDLRYATVNNFMKRLMYPAGTKATYLRLPAARALSGVQEELEKQGYGLLIFDAYRPYAVTVKFWELVKDERYVANPARGSGHNRGIAVDLTIIEKRTGKQLNMGTGFDNFSDTAHHSFKNLPAEILSNRNLLKQVMEKYGFKVYNEEWWHYSWPDAARFEILDLDFRKLRKKL